MSKATLLCVWLVAACATGGSGSSGDDDGRTDAAVRADASTGTPTDGGARDASVPGDAQGSQTPSDAGSGSGLFCSANSECTTSGECCVNLGGPGFCAPGTPVGGSICIPD